MLKAWYSLMMPSQCRLSSRTDQLTIWPMPFILDWRGKFISMAKLANSCRPSEKPPNMASVRQMSASVSTPNWPMKSCLSRMASYSMKAPNSLSGMPMVSSSRA
ncbi:hypothetical protein D3C85_1314220 [compost metagenome]